MDWKMLPFFFFSLALRIKMEELMIKNTSKDQEIAMQQEDQMQN